jgi:squalene-hopene/tetraprenyl-beta-curcumene cyclase
MPESKFFGATLAALAAGSAPAEYRNLPEVRGHVAALTAYLQREREGQPLHNRLMLLWASTKLREALPGSMRQPLIDEVWSKQQADGGWTMEALGPWKAHPAAPPSAGSNSYATGLAAFVLQRAGAAHSDPRLIRALDWLSVHQDREKGNWTAESMNKKFEAGSMQVRFMNDAATSFAALALLEHVK